MSVNFLIGKKAEIDYIFSIFLDIISITKKDFSTIFIFITVIIKEVKLKKYEFKFGLITFLMDSYRNMNATFLQNLFETFFYLYLK